MSQTVTPAGLVLNPLLEEENFLFPNPVIPGPNFLANTPFLGGLPNPLQLNVFTPPLLGGLLGGGIMMPVAIQLGHNLNPPAALGVGLPTAPMPPWWPVPNPVPEPTGNAATDGLPEGLPANFTFFILGSSLVILLAVKGWKRYQKIKENAKPPIEEVQEINVVDFSKPLRYRLPEKNPNFFVDRFQPTSMLNERNNVSLVQITYDGAETHLKILGVQIFMPSVPFVLALGQSGELSVWLKGVVWLLIRRWIARLVINNLVLIWRVFALCCARNACLFILTWPKKITVFVAPKSNKTVFSCKQHVKVFKSNRQNGLVSRLSSYKWKPLTGLHKTCPPFLRK
jgi:hypothetical protein